MRPPQFVFPVAAIDDHRVDREIAEPLPQIGQRQIDQPHILKPPLLCGPAGFRRLPGQNSGVERGLPDDHDTLRGRKQPARQRDGVLHRGIGCHGGVVGSVPPRDRRIARALERHDPCPWRKPFPTGEDEVTGHGAGGNDDVESPVGVLLDEPAGRAFRVVHVPAEPDEVQILDERLVAHPLRLGQPCPEPLHELHERRARGPLLVDDEDPLDRHRLRRGFLRRPISRRRAGNYGKRAWNRAQQKPPASRHGHDVFPRL